MDERTCDPIRYVWGASDLAFSDTTVCPVGPLMNDPSCSLQTEGVDITEALDWLQVEFASRVNIISTPYYPNPGAVKAESIGGKAEGYTFNPNKSLESAASAKGWTK